MVKIAARWPEYFYLFQRLRACGLPLEILYQCRVRPNTFLFVWCQECWSPKYPPTVPPRWPCHEVSKKYYKELFRLQLKHFGNERTTPTQYSVCVCVCVCACVRACVRVTSPLLKVPAYLAELAACRNFYVLMREIYSMGVVSSSVQLFRKWEINFDGEDCSALTRVVLFVSEAQGMWPSSRDIIRMLSPPKDFFVCVMSRVLKTQIICLQSPRWPCHEVKKKN